MNFLDTFSPLSDRNFRTYMGGQTISLIGTWMQTTAQGWLVWQLTGRYGIDNREAILGIVTALGFAPLFFVSPFSGVLADRLDRRRVIIVTQVIAMILAFTLAFLVQTDLVRIWHVIILATLLGIVGAVDFPAQSAFIGDLAGLDQVRKASALNATMIQLGRMLGPVVAGLTIANFGIATAFWLNGLSFLAVIASLFMVRANQVRRPSSGNPLSELLEGLRFMRSQPRIIDLLICTFIVPMFVISAGSLFPAFATDVLHGNETTLGYLTGASGAGALVGALFFAPQLARMKRIGIAMVGFLIWSGIWLALSSLTNSLYLAMTAIFLVSISLPTVLAGSNGLLQMLAPPNMRARVISLWIVTSFGAQPIGSLIGGYLASAFGVQVAFLVNGLMMVACALLLFALRPDFRSWQMTRPVTPAPAAASGHS